VIETFVRGMLGLAGIYLGLGLLAAIVLHARGLREIDPGVVGAGWLFRVLVTPGILALWPVLLPRWLRARGGAASPGAVHRPLSSRGIRAYHRRLTWLVLVLVPLAAAAAVALRPGDPSRGIPPRLGSGTSAPLPEVALEEPAPFGSRPIALRVRRDGSRTQLEIVVRGDLGIAMPALLWEPAGGGPTRFLARIGTPGVRRLDVGDGTLDAGGRLVLYALGHGETADVYDLAPGAAGDGTR